MYGHKQRSQYYCWFLNMFIAIVLVISFIFLLLFVYHFNSFRFISLNYGACDWELVAAFRMMLVQRTKANLLCVLHVQKRYTHGFKLTFACVFEHEYTIHIHIFSTKWFSWTKVERRKQENQSEIFHIWRSHHNHKYWIIRWEINAIKHCLLLGFHSSCLFCCRMGSVFFFFILFFG